MPALRDLAPPAPPPPPTPIGVVYLLHYPATLLTSARHYMGWTQDLAARILRHERGRGARMTRAMRDIGLRPELVRTWPMMTRAEERRLKSRRQHARLCPVCRDRALAIHAAEERQARRRRGLVAAPPGPVGPIIRPDLD